MLTLYHAPLTRSVRVLWLLEELGLPYELKAVKFAPPTRFFSQQTPLGKLPVIEDGEVVICESGAILEYILERYGEGRLAPPIGSPRRGAYLQWMHFAEGTAYPPLGVIIWRTRYKGDVQDPDLLEDARARASASLDFVQRQLGDGLYLLGDEFSAADIMMCFSLVVAQLLGVLDDRYPTLASYLDRLRARPAFQKASAPSQD